MRNKAADILLESHPATNPHDVAPRIEPHQIGNRAGRVAAQATGPAADSDTARLERGPRAGSWLLNVTPTGYERWKVPRGIMPGTRQTSDGSGARWRPGEIFCYWPQTKIAAELGVQRAHRSAGASVPFVKQGVIAVRQRVRPYGAAYVFPVRSGVLSGVLSGVRSHREIRTEPRENPE